MIRCVLFAFALIVPTIANVSVGAESLEDWDAVASDSCGECEACRNGEGHCEECYGVDTDPGRPRKPHRKMPGDVDRGDCPPLRYRIDDCKRAGNPHAVAPWAVCDTRAGCFGRYEAGFVGGGAAFANVPQSPLPLFSRGREREANGRGSGSFGEGTWGMDYQGLFGHSNIWLKYTQGRRQGGEGAYRTDGEPKWIAAIKRAVHE